VEQKHARSSYDDGGRRRSAILQSFRCGARRPWCRRVWQTAIKACGGTQDSAAQRLFVTTSAVSEGLQHGRLSIDTLVVMLAELKPHGWQLPKLPPRQELMAEGYIEAMAYLREPSQTASKRLRISRDDLAVLSAALSDDDWSKTIAHRDHALSSGEIARLRRADANLAALAAHISKSASRRQGKPIDRSLEQLCQLHRTWAAAWTDYRNAVPYAWTEDT